MATTISTNQAVSALPQKKGDPPNIGTVKSGRAIAFDGVVDCLTVTDDNSLDVTSITVAAWINPDNFTAENVIVEKAYSTGFEVSTDNSTGKIKVNAKINDSYQANLHTGGTATVTGQWNRIVWTYNKTLNTSTTYLNGALSEEVTPTAGDGSGLNTNSSSMHIGKRDDNTLWFPGDMSDVQIWDTAWTLTDVQNDYTHPEMLAHTFSGTSLTESNLKAWYPMTEGGNANPQTTIFDGSPKVLGSELISNGGFTQTPLGTGWTVTDTDVDNYVVFDGSTARLKFLNISPITTLSSSASFTSGKTYKLVVDIASVTSGGVKVDASGISELFNTVGINTRIVQPTVNSSLAFYRATSNVDLTFNSVSFKEVQKGNHATSVFYGDELVTNGDFATDSDWTKINATISGGKGNLDGYGQTSLLYQNILTQDKFYKVTFTVSDYNELGNAKIINSNGNTYYTITENGTFTVYFKHIFADGLFYFRAISGAVFSIDNVSVKEEGITDTGFIEGQETIFQPAFVGQNRMMAFDGVDDYITCGANPHSIATFSLSLWFSCSSATATTNNALITFGDSNTAHFTVSVYEQEIYASYENGSGDVRTKSNGLDLFKNDEWYHLVCSNSSGTLTWYVNGSAVTVATIQTLTAQSCGDLFEIGRNDDKSAYFNGFITEVSIFSGTALSSTQVQELYNDGVPLDLTSNTLTDSPTLSGYWRNNKLTTAGLWDDLSTNSNNGTVSGSPNTILLPEGTTAGRDINGFFLTHPNKNYLSLDGTDGCYMEIPHSEVFNFGTGDFSIDFWVKVNNITDNVPFVHKLSAYYGKGFSIYMNDALSNQFKFKPHIEDDSTTATGVSSTARNCHTWYYYCATFDRSGNVTNYVGDASTVPLADGATDISSVSGNINNTDKVMQFGVWTTTSADIMIDDVRIYNRVLDINEIKKNWRHGSAKHKD